MEEQATMSGAQDITDGVQDEPKGGDEVDKPKLISNEDHQRALSDMHKYKKGMKDLQDQIDIQNKKSKGAEEEALRKNNSYKTLYENKVKDFDDLSGKHKRFQEGFLDNEKFNAVRQEAIKAGMHDGALEDIERFNLDGVIVEQTDQGRVLVSGQSEWIAELKKMKPFLFKQADSPVFNGGGGASLPIRDTEITASDVVYLERKWKKTRTAEDRTKYELADKKFKENRKRV